MGQCVVKIFHNRAANVAIQSDVRLEENLQLWVMAVVTIGDDEVSCPEVVLLFTTIVKERGYLSPYHDLLNAYKIMKALED